MQHSWKCGWAHCPGVAAREVPETFAQMPTHHASLPVATQPRQSWFLRDVHNCLRLTQNAVFEASSFRKMAFAAGLCHFRHRTGAAGLCSQDEASSARRAVVCSAFGKRAAKGKSTSGG